MGGLKLATARGREELVANFNDLIEEEVVEDTVAAQDDDVALVSGHAVHGAAPLNDLDRHALIKVRVHPVVDPADLQWALRVAVDALHLRVEDYLEAPHVLVAPQHEDLAVADGEHRDHGVQLAMDHGAVVHDREQRRRGPHGLRRLVRGPHEWDWALVGAILRGRALVRNQLRHGELLACLHQLLRQLRRVQAVLRDLRHAVGHAHEHRRHQRHIRVDVAAHGLQRVRLLVLSCAEAERFVLLVLLGQVLLAPLQVLEVGPLPLRAHQERGRPAQAPLHGWWRPREAGGDVLREACA
mmetsp:Transcript_56485/g.145438  ORF Transcript_56485/g.145438 Transcript_56485/m.145438 type:complete len:298 (-) Transcript_56485:2-895(-)